MYIHICIYTYIHTFNSYRYVPLMYIQLAIYKNRHARASTRTHKHIRTPTRSRTHVHIHTRK